MNWQRWFLCAAVGILSASMAHAQCNSGGSRMRGGRGPRGGGSSLLRSGPQFNRMPPIQLLRQRQQQQQQLILLRQQQQQMQLLLLRQQQQQQQLLLLKQAPKQIPVVMNQPGQKLPLPVGQQQQKPQQVINKEKPQQLQVLVQKVKDLSDAKLKRVILTNRQRIRKTNYTANVAQRRLRLNQLLPIREVLEDEAQYRWGDDWRAAIYKKGKATASE